MLATYAFCLAEAAESALSAGCKPTSQTQAMDYASIVTCHGLRKSQGSKNIFSMICRASHGNW